MSQLKDLDNDTLSKLHELQLEAMDEIHRFCKENTISYFLDSGTALGAVRHGGFIPWDDDIDIGMMRKDYEKFLSLAPLQLSNKYFIQTHETEPNYNNFHAKIRIRNTYYPQEYTVGYAERGIQIDIFPFDFLPNDLKKAVRYIHISRFKRKLSDNCSEGKADNLIKKIKLGLIKLFPADYYRTLFNKHCTKYTNTNHVTCFSYKMTRKMDLVFNTKDIVPVKEVSFEGRKYFIMNDPDAYLKVMYGDYMTLPPENKRICHVNGEIIFDLSKPTTQERGMS